MKGRAVAAMLLALAVAAVIAVPSALGSKKDLTKVTICYANAASDFTPMWVAKQEGIFQANGLDANLFLARGSGAQILQSGDCQINLDSATPNLTALARGADVAMFGGLANRFEFKLVARAGSGISKVTDLKGKTLALSSPGAAVDTAGRAMLKLFGVDPKSVNIVYISSITARLAALSSGNIDALIASPPVSPITAGGKATEIYDLRSLRFILVAEWAKRSYISQHPDVIKAFLRSITQASTWMKNPANKDKVMAYLGQLTAITDPASLTESYNYAIPSFQDEPLIDPISLQNSIDFVNSSIGSKLDANAALDLGPLVQVLTYSLSTPMNAHQETPRPKGVATNAKGSFSGTLAPDGTLKWKLTFNGLTGPATAATINVGKANQAGPGKVTLCAPCTSGQTGTVKIGHGLSKSIKAGLGYVHIKTKANPTGEIRGQLSAQLGS